MNRSTTFSTIEKERDNGSGAQLPASGLCLHEQFEEWVDRSPDRVAIWGLSETTSFGVLDASTTLADFCGSFVAIVYGSAGMLAAEAG